MKINSLTKSLSVLAITAVMAGSAFADPGSSHASFAPINGAASPGLLGIGLFRTPAVACPMMTAQTTFVPSANLHNPGVVAKVTGYTYDGCTGTGANMACQGTSVSCAAMRQ